jgi:glycosyltransferase involved in cell wall biosynthesis
VTLKRSEVFKTVIPTKMLEFMACAKPIVLAVQGQASELLNAAGAGICVPPQEPASMVAAIRQLRDDRDLCRSLGQNGRRYIVENLSRRQTAEKYIGLLEDITSADSCGVSMAKAKVASATRA